MPNKSVRQLAEEAEHPKKQPRRMGFLMDRPVHALLRDRRDSLDHVRHLSLQQFVEFLVTCGRVTEEQLLNFEPTANKPGRPLRRRVESQPSSVSEEQPLGSEDKERHICAPAGRHHPDYGRE